MGRKYSSLAQYFQVDVGGIGASLLQHDAGFLSPQPCPEHPTLSSLPFSHMATPYLSGLGGFTSGTLDSSVTSGGEGVSARRTNALSTKLTSVLSSSYADYEIRDALRLLDARGVHNDEETRRNLKLNAQKEVIDCNAKIVDDFGQVAEVCIISSLHSPPFS